MKRKGFTLVELLVVIAIIAMLMSILMPALAKVKAIAQRLVCGTNLSGIGKAMMLYATDFDDDFPVAGGPEATWGNNGEIYDCAAYEPKAANFTVEQSAYGRPGQNSITVSSSLYLLVRYEEVQPKQFYCRSDVGTDAFKSKDANIELAEFWDFCDPDVIAGRMCSYSYHLPYFDEDGNPGFPLTSTSEPGSPVCADRSPFMDTNVNDEILQDYVENPDNATSAPHQDEGQNVLFCDAHVEFLRSPMVGIEEDNIWINWDGIFPENYRPGTGAPLDFADAYLVNESQEDFRTQ